MRKHLLLLFLFLSAVAVANSQVRLTQKDTATYSAMKQATDSIMKKLIEVIFRDVNAAYKKDSTIFNDKTGKQSIIKFFIYVSNRLLPMRQQLYVDWAKRCLNEKELKYYKKINYHVIPDKTGNNLIIPERTVSFDAAWASELHTNITLMFNPEFNYFEYLFYRCSYDITGILEPSYLPVHKQEEDISRFMINSLLATSFEFFINMHEFYHLYYEDKVGLSHRDEIKADMYALRQFRTVTGDADSNEVIDDKYIRSLSSLIGADNQLNLIGKYCPGNRLLNDSVLVKEFGTSFIGLRIAQLNYGNTSRDFFSNKLQIAGDISRLKRFTDIIFKELHCRTNDTTKFCCFINQQIEGVKDIEEMKKKTDKIAFKRIMPTPKSYLQIDKEENGFLPFNLGNYYAFSQRNYAKALEYYVSANLLDQKSGYTILCNLIAYEIYSHDEKLRNNTLAKEYLEKAKALNISIPTISESIMSALP